MADGTEQGAKAKLPDETENEFVERMDTILEHNAVGMGLTIGYRVGLINVMSELQEPKTSLEIAQKAGLNER